MTPPEESAPAAAPAPRPRSILERANAVLTSPKLAIALLAVVLVCCVVGVTVVRGVRAGQLIFGTLWFNGLLVLLAISSGVAFFTRIWRRKLTLVSAGMILFHVSFMAMLGGIVFNSLFHFRGALRLTEGETLPNGQLESYDEAEWGRLFDPSSLRGETTLVKTHVNFEVDGQNKKVAYEVAVEDGETKERGIIYATQNLVFEGVRYFRSKEGYSVLVVMFDKDGRELFGAYVPLQSYKKSDGSYRYATGAASGEAVLGFPPEKPRAYLGVSYRPSTVAERAGDVTFRVEPFRNDGAAPLPPGHEGVAAVSPRQDGAAVITPGHAGVPVGPSGNAAVAAAGRTGEVVVGGQFDAGDFKLSPMEIRYWVGMEVRYDPGLTVILASLCSGLGGMVLTFIGRVRQGGSKRRAAQT